MDNSTRTHLDGIADYRSALDALCGLARHSLMLFEQDLEETGFNSEARHESLRRFLLGGRNNRLLVLVRDARALGSCPRMATLLRQFDDRMQVRCDSQPEAAAPFCVADGAHYVRRFHVADPRGLLVTDDPENARLLESRFDEIWENSHQTIPTSTLGL